MFHPTPRLILRNRADIACRVRNLVRKTAYRISHVRHLFLQADKGVVVACVPRFVASFSVGRKVRCHPFLRDTRPMSTSVRAEGSVRERFSGPRRRTAVASRSAPP